MATRYPMVSVVIGSYNYGHFIEDAIESVRNQSFPVEEVEIVVVDDGSTDDTRERLRKYAGALRYIYKENGGQATAFNTGLREARGEIVALLDADDLWHRDKLSSVVREFESDPAVDVVHHYMEVVGRDGQVIGMLPDARAQGVISFSRRPLASYLNGQLPFTPPTSGMSIRADCLRKLAPIPEEYRICADLYILSLLPFHAREFRLVERPLGRYRIHGANTWTGPAGAPKPEAMIRFHRLTLKYIEATAREFGQDASRLKRTFEAMEAELTIELYKRDRHRLAALRAACRLDDPKLDGHRLALLMRRAGKMLSIIVPDEEYIALRRRWRRSRLSGILNRVLTPRGAGILDTERPEGGGASKVQERVGHNDDS